MVQKPCEKLGFGQAASYPDRAVGPIDRRAGCCTLFWVRLGQGPSTDVAIAVGKPYRSEKVLFAQKGGGISWPVSGRHLGGLAWVSLGPALLSRLPQPFGGCRWVEEEELPFSLPGSYWPLETCFCLPSSPLPTASLTSEGPGVRRGLKVFPSQEAGSALLRVCLPCPLALSTLRSLAAQLRRCQGPVRSRISGCGQAPTVWQQPPGTRLEAFRFLTLLSLPLTLRGLHKETSVLPVIRAIGPGPISVQATDSSWQGLLFLLIPG